MAAQQNSPTVMVEQAPPLRVEIRIGGKVRFLNDVYGVDLVVEDDALTLRGTLHPTMVSVKLSPPERFGDDPRDGEEPLLQVHSGRRDIEPEVEPEKAPEKAPQRTPSKKAAKPAAKEQS